MVWTFAVRCTILYVQCSVFEGVFSGFADTGLVCVIYGCKLLVGPYGVRLRSRFVIEVFYLRLRVGLYV